MLYAIWRWLQLCLPYGLVLFIYRHNKALPTNIKTSYGRGFKAVLITTEYGVLFSEERYVANRAKELKKQKQHIEELNNKLLEELNSMTIEERESLSEYFKDK